MSNSDIEQSGTVKGHLPNGANLSGRISNGLSLSGHISIGGAGDLIIRMTVEGDDEGNFTVTSCDTTVEQINAAVSAEKRVVVIAPYEGIIYELPLLYYIEGYAYYFGALMNGQIIISSVKKTGEDISEWQFFATLINAESVGYSNAALPNTYTVKDAFDALVPKSHSHDNKDILDKFAESDGKPTYSGEALGGDFIIKMTLASDDEGRYTVTSCDTTVEQIDAAVAAGKRVVVIASYGNSILELPMLTGEEGGTHYFGTFLFGQVIISIVYKVAENESEWVFDAAKIEAESVGYFDRALPNISTVGGALNELVPKSHSHDNKDILDKFAESDGKPTYSGEALGGDFIIKMTLAIDDNGNYTVTSCDATVEQIDAAVTAGKKVVVIASDGDTIFELPMVQGIQDSSYYFGTFFSGQVMASSVFKAENESQWEFVVVFIDAGNVAYYNTALPNISTVGGALNELVPKSHSHDNKDVLDKLSVLGGKLQYNGSDVGLKGDKGDKGDTPVKGTDYWTAADKTEIVNDTLAALPTWTGGSY